MRTYPAGCLLSHFEIQTLLHELKKGTAMETPCREKVGSCTCVQHIDYMHRQGQLVAGAACCGVLEIWQQVDATMSYVR